MTSQNSRPPVDGNEAKSRKLEYVGQFELCVCVCVCMSGRGKPKFVFNLSLSQDGQPWDTEQKGEVQ